MLNRSIAGFTVAAVVSSAVAQTGHFARWEVSLDNGGTWQRGNVSAPQSQTSAIVRLRWQHLTNGVVTPIEQATTFLDAAMFEAYVSTPTLVADTASNMRQMVLGSPSTALLVSSGVIGSRRVDNVLAIDRLGESLPLGQGLGVRVLNRVDGVATPDLDQSFPLLQYTLNLDGTPGDRVLSGLFLPFNTGRPFTLAPDQIAVGDRQINQFVAADITHLPSTITIIPAPAALPLLAAGSLLAMRRRR